jgi:hypothetical protein
LQIYGWHQKVLGPQKTTSVGQTHIARLALARNYPNTCRASAGGSLLAAEEFAPRPATMEGKTDSVLTDVADPTTAAWCYASAACAPEAAAAAVARVGEQVAACASAEGLPSRARTHPVLAGSSPLADNAASATVVGVGEHVNAGATTALLAC